jgi:hypothetical protein
VKFFFDYVFFGFHVTEIIMEYIIHEVFFLLFFFPLWS